VGVGANYVDTLARFVRECDVDVVLEAGRYTLLDQSAATELLPECTERGVRVIAAGVFNGGILADPIRTPWYDYQPAPREVRVKVAAIEERCRRHGVSLVEAAVAFPATHPAIDIICVGARTPEEVTVNVASHEAGVPPALWDDLSDGDLVQVPSGARS
jgi:D-threo-aldose 1-dehydrogenase